jgi:hypothetical protein
VAPARITGVSITGHSGNYSLTITGTGFGSFPAALPFKGYSPYVAIEDAGQSTQWGWDSSGIVHSSSGHPVNYNSWSSTRIVIAAVGLSPGDALTVNVTSPGPNAGRGATWGGNAPPKPSTWPEILHVTFSGSGENLRMTVLGNGFGKAPVGFPYTGDLRYIEVEDWSRACTSAGTPELFSAGYAPWDGASKDAVTLRIASWTTSRIIVDGFAGAYGSTRCVSGAGGYSDGVADDWPDAMTVTVWNTHDTDASAAQVSWGGYDDRAVGLIAPPAGTGYWIAGSDGKVFSFGSTSVYGELAGTHLAGPVVALGRTFDGRGYWLAESTGSIHAYGDASPAGAVRGNALSGTVVGLLGTSNSRSGFWIVTSTGAVQTHGSAEYLGSMAGHHLNQPIVGMATTPGGHGYWLVASDGGIFTFGNAKFLGSTGGIHLNQPIVGMAATPDGKGYWLVAADGGVFTYGDATYYGSLGSIPINAAVVGMAATADGKGYWMVGADGGVYALGDAHYYGSTGGKGI